MGKMDKIFTVIIKVIRLNFNESFKKYALKRKKEALP